MLLAIDVGNTNIVLGLFRAEHLLESWRVKTSSDKTSDEYGLLFLSLLETFGYQKSDIEGVIVCSVVPPLNPIIGELSTKYFQQTPLWVGPGLKTGMPVLYDNPKEVGADRIVNAVAAYEKYKRAGIIVDFGTATTFDVVSEDGEYLGGAIAPGIGIGAEALFRRTAKLPRVEIEPPPQAIGKNTVQSIQSGLYFGYVGLVDELVNRIKSELGQECFVVATGGYAPIFAENSRTISDVDLNLTLKGLYLLYQKNRKKRTRLNHPKN